MVVLETINLSGVTHEIAFTNGAFVRFESRTGTDVLSFITQMEIGKVNFTQMCDFIACGIETASAIKGENKKFTALDIADLSDISDLKQLGEILQKYMPEPEKNAVAPEKQKGPK